jgi:hypothetical protein
MALPKNYKTNLRISKSYQHVGPELRHDMTKKIMAGSGYLPQGVYLEDMDSSLIDFVTNKVNIVLDGEKIPVVLLTIQRWTEFTKTWEFGDDYGNMKMPFITIVRHPDPQPGQNQVGLWNIPGHRTYTTYKVPTLNNGREGYDIYQIPQPTSIDVTYDVRLFCNKMRHLNIMNSAMQEIFNSRQFYIYPKQHPMPLLLESIGDESSVSDFEQRRFYVQNFELLLQGYELKENLFKVTPGVDRIVQLTEIDGLKSTKLKE